MAIALRSARLRFCLLSTAASLLATPALAQNPAPPPDTSPQAPQTENQSPPTAPQDVANQSDVIIITGTSRARAAFNTPLAVTSLGEARLQKIASSSQADILNTVPTLKGDAGGGEVASNIFVRGLPSGGQYQFTPLMYDGLPVLSTFGLNSSAFDVYYHNDFGIDRLEFVQGGVSNLFGPGSVAGLINYLSKTGTENFRGTAQVEVAEKGRVRTDVAVSGPLGGNWYYAFSGFYRYDEGPVKTDLKTKGYQLRGNIKYRLPDGSGSVTVYGQWIDDQVQFYLPIPLNGSNRNRLPGNDGRKVYQVLFREGLEGLAFNTPDGLFTTDAEEGVMTRGGQIALAFDKQFGNGWGVNGRTKWSKYKHQFALWSDGDGVINVPETLQSFLTNRGLGSLANASFTFADGSGAVPSNFLLFANRITDRDRPVHDFTGELNITKEMQWGSTSHKFTLGGFYGNASARDINVTTTYLAEFNNQPRLVNVVVTNPTTGAQTIVTRNGLLNAGAGYVNNKHEAERYAIYGADQIDAGRLKFDIGGRIERINADLRRERTATFVTDPATPNLATALRDVIWGNGTFLTGKVHTSEWALAAGALYKLTNNINLYANASRGYFFPEPRAVAFNALGVPQSYSAEIIKQAEAGVKINQGAFSATMAAFYNKLTNRRQVLFVNDGQGGFTERVNLVATEAYGGDVTARVQIMPDLAFEGNITLQHAKYSEFQQAVAGVPTSNPALIGNTIERQPDVLYNAGLYYDDNRFDASLFTNYTGDVFTASNNAIVLKGFHVVNLDAGYKFGLAGHKLRLGINVFNLFNTDATTEGSPRQDNNQTTGGQFFVGRPVLPRRIAGRLTVDF
ncbi:MAG TPA: TonB-dependent receptor [Sphingomicrobium sp.]|nr:TonB-dependent receptor [Sphingomicrobium sp.]